MTTLNSLSKQPINWPALMERYEQGELTCKQFCKENNISLPRFKYHRHKCKQQYATRKQTTMIPINLKEVADTKPTAAARHFQVTFNNGLYCQIPITMNAEKLKQLMEVLQAC